MYMGTRRLVAIRRERARHQLMYRMPKNTQLLSTMPLSKLSHFPILAYFPAVEVSRPTNQPVQGVLHILRPATVGTYKQCLFLGFTLSAFPSVHLKRSSYTDHVGPRTKVTPTPADTDFPQGRGIGSLLDLLTHLFGTWR